MEEYNKAITLLIHLIVLNNTGGVARLIRQAGYDTKSYIPKAEMEAALLQLYLASPEKFFKIMKQIPWNYGDMETNKPEIKDELIKLSGVNTDETDKSKWWTEILNLMSIHPSYLSQFPDNNKKYFGVFGIILIAIAVIVIIIVVINRSI